MFKNRTVHDPMQSHPEDVSKLSCHEGLLEIKPVSVYNAAHVLTFTLMFKGISIISYLVIVLPSGLTKSDSLRKIGFEVMLLSSKL